MSKGNVMVHMNVNVTKLDEQDSALLRAILSDGATQHQPYKTTLSSLAQKLGIGDNDVSETLLTESLRRLIMAEYRIETAGRKAIGRLLSEVEFFDDGQVSLVVNMPIALVDYL